MLRTSDRITDQEYIDGIYKFFERNYKTRSLNINEDILFNIFNNVNSQKANESYIIDRKLRVLFGFKEEREFNSTSKYNDYFQNAEFNYNNYLGKQYFIIFDHPDNEMIEQIIVRNIFINLFNYDFKEKGKEWNDSQDMIKFFDKFFRKYNEGYLAFCFSDITEVVLNELYNEFKEVHGLYKNGVNYLNTIDILRNDFKEDNKTNTIDRFKHLIYYIKKTMHDESSMYNTADNDGDIEYIKNELVGLFPHNFGLDAFDKRENMIFIMINHCLNKLNDKKSQIYKGVYINTLLPLNNLFPIDYRIPSNFFQGDLFTHEFKKIYFELDDRNNIKEGKILYSNSRDELIIRGVVYDMLKFFSSWYEIKPEELDEYLFLNARNNELPHYFCDTKDY